MNEIQPIERLETYHDTATDMEYAGFWISAAATLIDTVLLLWLFLPVEFMLIKELFEYPFTPNPVGTALLFLLEWVVPAVATLAFWLTKAATPGKMNFRLKILDADSGEPVSALQLLGRYVGYFLSLIPVCMGYIWVGVDERKQGWHDKIAGTIVVISADPEFSTHSILVHALIQEGRGEIRHASYCISIS